MKTLIKKLMSYSIIMLTGFVLCVTLYASESPITSPDAPVYNPPNPDADKRRLEAGESDSVNRGVRVRGVRIRSSNTRGGKRNVIKSY